MKSFLLAIETLGVPLAKTLLLIIVMSFLLTAMSARAEEKPLIIRFTGYGETTSFTCKINEAKEIICQEIKKPSMSGQEFFLKLMNRRI